MKLLFIIANDEYFDEIADRLLNKGFSATQIASTGEFVKYGDTILLLGVEDGVEEEVIELIKTASKHNQDLDQPFFGKVSIYVLSLKDHVKIIGKTII